MREDMKKVLTERPRRGSANSYHSFRRKLSRGDLEDLPSCQGMRRPYTSYCYDGIRKEFSDLIGPLRRYLHSCVGRKWDDVWCEISSKLSNNTVDSHLKDHVLQEIDIQATIIDGDVKINYNGALSDPRGLYVDPSSRTLQKTQETPRKKPVVRYYEGNLSYKVKDGVCYPVNNKYPLRKIIGVNKEFVKINGIWYWVVFKAVDSNLGHVDFITGSTIRKGIYRSGKRQVNCSDLKKNQLVNDH